MANTDPSGETCDCPGGGDNNSNFNTNINTNDCPDCNKALADAIKGWVGGWASARNFDEAGTAVGKAARDATNFVVGNVRSFFKGLFGGGHSSSGPVPNMASNVNMSPYNNGRSNSYGQEWSGGSGNSNLRLPQYISIKPVQTELGMGPFEWVEGGGALELIKIAKESSLASKTVVIGEDMLNRVIPFAEENGFKYFKPRGTNPANWMKNQSKWIYRQIKDPTVRIIDIGSKELEATSKYYMKELEMLRKYLGY